MKKIILTAVAVFGFAFANAQEEEKGNGGFAKGDVFVSGAVTFGSSKTGDFKANAFEIAPKVGYFVTENIAVGASVGFQSLKFNFYNYSPAYIYFCALIVKLNLNSLFAIKALSVIFELFAAYYVALLVNLKYNNKKII